MVFMPLGNDNVLRFRGLWLYSKQSSINHDGKTNF